jgi:hypothetical protein
MDIAIGGRDVPPFPFGRRWECVGERIQVVHDSKGVATMKAVCAVLVAFLYVTQSSAAGVPANYAGARFGVYSPRSGDMNDYGAGCDGEAFIGRRLHPHVAVEIGAGGFSSKGPSGEYIGRLSGVPWTGTFEVSAIPVMATVLGLLPVGRGELFLGAGAGACFLTIKAEMKSPGYPTQSIEASDSPMGMHVRTGGSYSLSERLCIGGALQYLRAGAEFRKTIAGYAYSRDFALDGVAATASVFYRF